MGNGWRKISMFNLNIEILHWGLTVLEKALFYKTNTVLLVSVWIRKKKMRWSKIFTFSQSKKQNLYVQTKHLRLYVEVSLFWRKHYVLILTSFHSFPFEQERETILLLSCFPLLNFHFHLEYQQCLYGRLKPIRWEIKIRPLNFVLSSWDF